MDKTICAGIVTFNPEIKKLENNIRSIITQVSRVVLCDNCSENIGEIKELIRNQFHNYEIDVIEFQENKGIALALNVLVKDAINNGYAWIITLDQDSECPSTLIQHLKNYADATTAIVAPRIIYRGNEKFAKNVNNITEDVEWVITSASLTNVNVWKAINGFDEQLFIDKVDYDFCIRARRAGYRITKVNTIYLLHELGNLRCRKIFWKTVYVTNHSAFRKYYMTRNSIYLKKKLNLNSSAYIMKIFFKTLLFENNKFDKIKAIKCGIKDAKKMI